MSRIHYDKLAGPGIKLPAVTPDPRHLTEIGRIAVGEKLLSQKGKLYPASTDHFVIRSNYQQNVHRLYGEKPSELPVFFYTDEAGEACFERLEIRDSGGRLYGSGDGERFSIWSTKTNRYVTISTAERPSIMADTAAHIGTEWQPVLSLRLAIKNIPALGYWQITTKGAATSLVNLRDRFDGALSSFGFIKFLPFLLTVKKVKSNNPGEVKHYPVIDLVPQFSIETGLQLSQFIADNPGFNPARLALFSAEQLASPSALLLGPGAH